MTAAIPLHRLETNIISDLIKNLRGKVAQRLLAVGDEAIRTSIIVAGEPRYGCARKASARLLQRVDDVLDIIPVLPFDVPAEIAYGRIRCDLELDGQLIGGNDPLIAAPARALGMTLVTAGIREFRWIADLTVENWL
ncbi:transcriptional regulator [Skermanella stibiiresistens SB22]|uniref:Transcriptional regulator n=1 Tax=Skermanella stibiiresistens SB22 TaxID=1385369 RepID=W9H6B0_9PROT|nr:type II toxin-antitoxin system VapC family toxin [Skermanella stibiiresistens]EWY41584.1 transcriptional regulator [Skermanella stibiiresistens SB22]